MYEITYPEVITYWIATTGENIGYGKTKPTQTTTSGADSFETFTDKNLWTAKLTELGITLNEDE